MEREELLKQIANYDKQIIDLLIEVDRIKEQKAKAENRIREIEFEIQLRNEREARIAVELENQKLKKRVKELEESDKEIVGMLEQTLKVADKVDVKLEETKKTLSKLDKGTEQSQIEQPSKIDVNDLEQKLKKLEETIIELQVFITYIDKDFERIKNQSSANEQIVSAKEKELEEIRTKLVNCQNERDDIRGKINEKIEELNQSNLSKEEKTEKISKLMVGEYEKLKVACQKTTQMWRDWGKVKDNLSEIQQTLSTSRLEAVQSLEKTKRNLWITVWILLVVVILLSLSLSLTAISKKKKKKQNKISPF